MILLNLMYKTYTENNNVSPFIHAHAHKQKCHLLKQIIVQVWWVYMDTGLQKLVGVILKVNSQNITLVCSLKIVFVKRYISRNIIHKNITLVSNESWQSALSYIKLLMYNQYGVLTFPNKSPVR